MIAYQNPCAECAALAAFIAKDQGISYALAYVKAYKMVLLNDIRFLKDAAGGTRDFIRTFIEMREMNWKNSDKYFHAKANFLSVSRGEGGVWVAEKLSNFRGWIDMTFKGDSYFDAMSDHTANRFGRSQTQYYNRRQYYNTLQKYRPKGLPIGH